jgi:hypothetical protein
VCILYVSKDVDKQVMLSHLNEPFSADKKKHFLLSLIIFASIIHIQYEWKNILTASVQPNRRLSKDFHWRNASNDWPICSIAKCQSGFNKTNKILKKPCFLDIPKRQWMQTAVLQGASLRNLHNFLPEEFLAIVSEKSNIKHEHISAKSNRLRLCLDK